MWVRIDDRFPRHPKVLAAGEVLGHRTDGIARVVTLFLACLCYSAEHLTDGVISLAALATMRQFVWNPHRVAEALAQVGLFERQPNAGYLIHDYHHYNPTSEDVKEKRSHVSAVRSKAGKAGADARWQDGKPMANALQDVKALPMAPYGPVPSRPVPSQNPKITPPANLSVDPEIAEKAGKFLERYPVIYAEERRGAHFQLKPVLHFATACELVAGWPDVKRLETMFRTFCKLPQSETMAWPGTPAQFLHLAPQIDVKLRQGGA